MKRTVNADDLTEPEVELFVAAIDKARAALGTQFLHSAAIRDDSNKLCEVRFSSDSDGQHQIAVVRVRKDGKLLPLERL